VRDSTSLGEPGIPELLGGRVEASASISVEGKNVMGKNTESWKRSEVNDAETKEREGINERGEGILWPRG